MSLCLGNIDLRPETGSSMGAGNPDHDRIEDLGELFDTFEREAFRLEALDDYSKSGNVDAYHAFLAGEPQPDFWLFDSESVAAMSYDGDGKFLGSQVLPPDSAAGFIRYRDTALAHAEPFTDWWAKYGV